MKTKNTARFILFTLLLSAMLLSACSAVGVPVTGDNSNVNGPPATGVVDDNGNSSNSNDVNSNDANSNDVNSNDANSNDINSNDANSNDVNSIDANSNDSGIEIVGVVEAITDDTITINGVTYLMPAGFTEFKDLAAVGDQVKVQVIFNADGTFTILEVEITSVLGEDNGNDANSNDDNGNDANSNDDNGNDSNSNDDNGSGGGGNDDSGGGNDNGGNDDGGGGNDNGGGSNDNG